MNHTPIPWKVGTRHPTRIVSDHAYVANTALPVDEESPTDEELANAEHIVKCVNAHDMLINTLKMIAGGCCNQGVCVEYAASALRDLGIEVAT